MPRRTGPPRWVALGEAETIDDAVMAVLSACDTGVGHIAQSEGVYGLRRALAIAGAQTQVVSLWKVSDEATCQLMDGYYGRLRAGVGRGGGVAPGAATAGERSTSRASVLLGSLRADR